MVETNESILSVHSGEKRKVAELRRDGTDELIRREEKGCRAAEGWYRRADSGTSLWE